ncbi:hypothetical protein [Halospina sp. K52047b]|uniref:hypothetical protein n=1 Tax=Halospina sp. K52047b TaxID=2614160 RepID=UPI00124A409D|nr:hypothetical protein [Halospina sp. K52047b]KAA8977828.1 hypothetical protein F3089_14720 [Halospina sp. K52047b]
MARPVTWRMLVLSNLITLLLTLLIIVSGILWLPALLFSQGETGGPTVQLPDRLPFRVTMPQGMTARVTNAVEIEVPLDERVSVPVRDTFNANARVDTNVPIQMTVSVDQTIPVKTTLDLDTRVEASIFGAWMTIPIRGRVPIDVDVPVKADIPVNQRIPLKLETPVSVDLDETLEVPMQTTFTSKARLLSPLAIQPEPLILGIEDRQLAVPLPGWWPFVDSTETTQ